ncbi:hypothetical protein [Nocardioides sp. TF02-7]|uniref:hypothetical protein n=1 Tax=Nocardioides sp. TF02-7 TaxID=2917724 RepID=UPI001F05FB76|nr:hypothetical protein [Nocardioides sp. TF02-7]UMG92998.1 hypothetical protein MF408_01170 [Nocardioides sp. TF02-7]
MPRLPRMENPRMDAKKLIAVVVVVFLGFWMLTDPSGLAENAKSAGGEGWGAHRGALHRRHRLRRRSLSW